MLFFMITSGAYNDVKTPLERVTNKGLGQDIIQCIDEENEEGIIGTTCYHKKLPIELNGGG
jgi:hypothetical protein